MATIPDFIEALAPITGMHPATLQRYMTGLTNAGKIRKSKKGGGRLAVHLDHIEGATVFLALSAIVPSGAAAAVDSLAPLIRVRVGQHVNLLTILAASILERAHILASNPNAIQAPVHGWELTVCVDPAYAFMTWNSADGTSREDFQSPSLEHVLKAVPGIRRQTVTTFDMIEVFSKLVADSLIKTNGVLKLQEDTPTTESKTPASLPGEPAPVRNRRTAKQLVSPNSDEASRIGLFFQPERTSSWRNRPPLSPIYAA